ncbi:sortase [Nocardioides kribbensis]|uniref:Sortase n=1 Tax=Nocardioides kribbensis TaxID=305517 RepID=A0ABV1P272_9ACTN
MTPRRPRRPHPRRLLAWLLLVAGCAVLVAAGTTYVGAGRETAAAQQRLAGQLPAGPRVVSDDDHGPVPVARSVATGRALAEIRVPRLGADWSWVAVEGTDDAQLATGPGHYTGTPLPGARGNSAFAGHRAGHGDPFLDFDTLRRGDEVVITQGSVRWTYRLTRDPEVVPVDATWVLDPTPGRRLTLTTCWPRYGSSKRMWVRGTLERVERQPGALAAASSAGDRAEVWPTGSR